MEVAVVSALMDRISIDPEVCFGKPCIRGTRIWVSLILDFLASGESEADILARYPELEPDDIRAALAYGAEVARERIVPIAMPASEGNSSWTRTSVTWGGRCWRRQVTT